ncbi:uncharacterized protein LOC142520850 [Primulina tabacum]|uniref:uncharacterized protein LOC142520850 n=1 Tax=Primulina tabacum TaxID=48773 RepID=UPI003F5945DD
MAVNHKDQALKKATISKNTRNNANHVLDFVRKKDRNEQKDASSDCSGKIKEVDDAELAFRLHRAMNSSPRILRDKCQGEIKVKIGVLIVQRLKEIIGVTSRVCVLMLMKSLESSPPRCFRSLPEKKFGKKNTLPSIKWRNIVTLKLQPKFLVSLPAKTGFVIDIILKD